MNFTLRSKLGTLSPLLTPVVSCPTASRAIRSTAAAQASRESLDWSQMVWGTGRRLSSQLWPLLNIDTAIPKMRLFEKQNTRNIKKNKKYNLYRFVLQQYRLLSKYFLLKGILRCDSAFLLKAVVINMIGTMSNHHTNTKLVFLPRGCFTFIQYSWSVLFASCKWGRIRPLLLFSTNIRRETADILVITPRTNKYAPV